VLSALMHSSVTEGVTEGKNIHLALILSYLSIGCSLIPVYSKLLQIYVHMCIKGDSVRLRLAL